MFGTTGGFSARAARLLAALSVAGLALFAALLSPAAVFAASDVQVFVGYADNLRAAAPNFPTPWAGSPDMVFAGCLPVATCTFDGGAVRLVNGASSAVTVDSVVIRFDTCTYDIWPRGTTLGPGEQLIVTQTVSGAGQGCSPETGLMDSSDIGPGGANWLGNCHQSGVIPELDITINGVTRTLRDTGQVLNTGGVDSADCPTPVANESTQWTEVGSIACPGATLTLAPSSQTHFVGTEATVRATLQNSCGTGLSGAVASFQVEAGPHPGVHGTGVTDANGVATFSYTGSVPGTDRLVSSVTNMAGTIVSNPVDVIWTAQRHMTGDAFALSSSGLVSISRTPEVGPVDTTSSWGQSMCVVRVFGLIDARSLCARVTTNSDLGSSAAQASVADARIGPAALPIVRIGVVRSSSRTTCSGSAGDVTIESISIGGVPVVVDTHPAPNTTLTVLGITLVLNEQLPVAGADHGLTVNAIHLTSLLGLDVVIASATSDIHDC
jgi:hypothetical protein